MTEAVLKQGSSDLKETIIGYGDRHRDLCGVCSLLGTDDRQLFGSARSSPQLSSRVREGRQLSRGRHLPVQRSKRGFAHLPSRARALISRSSFGGCK